METIKIYLFIKLLIKRKFLILIFYKISIENEKNILFVILYIG